MVRKKAATLNKSIDLEWRNVEPSRLETFSDAVFAFALTLVIVSLEVPRTFDDLLETLSGVFSFAACFAILFQIWNGQNIFFRRYGLNDIKTVTLNAFLLFVVLIYAYPLKFLTLLLFTDGEYMVNGHLVPMIRVGQTSQLMLIYGAGYSVINLIFYLLYLNAKKQAVSLNLTVKELYDTNTIKMIYLLNVGIGILSMVLAIILPSNLTGLSGYIYFLIPLTYMLWYPYRNKKYKKSMAVNN